MYTNFKGEYHHMDAPGIEHYPGVAHADELYLQWDHLDNIQRPLNVEDSIASLRSTTMWSNFVKYGNPTPEESEVGVIWTPFTKEEKK